MGSELFYKNNSDPIYLRFLVTSKLFELSTVINLKKYLDKKINRIILIDKTKYMFYTLIVNKKRSIFDKPG